MRWDPSRRDAKGAYFARLCDRHRRGMRRAPLSGMSKTAPRSMAFALSLATLALLVPRFAQADDGRLSGEVALGPMVLPEGPADDLGTFVDVGVSAPVVGPLVLRGGVGISQMYDRHFAPDTRPRVRAEALLEGELWHLRPLLGFGATLTEVSPAVFGLAGFGLEIAPAWSLGIDARAGAYWERDEYTPRGRSSLLEAQLRLRFPLF